MTITGSKKRKKVLVQEQNDSNQYNLFEANMLEWPVKDDIATMEFPIFTLATKKDTSIREFVSADKTKKVRITPSVEGAATVSDKDLLLFIGSQIVEARKAGIQATKRVKIDVYSFLTSCHRSIGGKGYQITSMLRRLKGTTIETNVITGGVEQTKGFGLIEDYEIVKHSKNGEGVLEVTVTISDWLWNSLIAHEVLTIDRRYFLIRQPIDKRIYELARKHVGKQTFWKCNIELLQDKTGSKTERRKFRSHLRKLMQRNDLPDYSIAFDGKTGVVFYTKDTRKLSAFLVEKQEHLDWFNSLDKPITVTTKDN